MDQDTRVFYATGTNTTSGFRIALTPRSTMPQSLRDRAEQSIARGDRGAVRRVEIARCPADAVDSAIGRAAERALIEGRIALDGQRCDFSVVEPFLEPTPQAAPGPR